MKVSVVIPAHNSTRWLAETLESVAAQTAPAHEVIVVDDGSTDGTADLAESLGAHCLRPGRVGVSAARNLGVQEASGELIAFLDADDLWAPEKLEVHATHMRAHPELLFTIAHMRHFQDGSSVEGIREDVLAGVYPAWYPSALVTRRQAFEVVGEFDESMANAADVDWFARATDLGVPMAVLPQTLLFKRAHADSIMWSTGPANLFLSLRRSVARKHGEVPER